MKFKKPGTIKAIKPDKNRWWYEKRPPGVTGATITFDKFIEDLDTKLVLGACLFGIVFKQAQKSELRRLYIMSFYETFSMTEIVEEWGFRPSVVKRMIAVGLIEKKKTGYKNFHYLYLSAKARAFVDAQNEEAIGLLKKLTEIKSRYNRAYYKKSGLHIQNLPAKRKKPPKIGEYDKLLTEENDI